jgi:hypothetical protein
MNCFFKFVFRHEVTASVTGCFFVSRRNGKCCIRLAHAPTILRESHVAVGHDALGEAPCGKGLLGHDLRSQ